MTIKEILIQNGVPAGEVDAVLQTMKDNKIFIVDEENLSIRYEKLKDNMKSLQGKREEQEKSISELKEKNLNIHPVEDYEKNISDLKEEINAVKLNSIIQSVIVKENVTDADYFKFKLKESDLHLNENGEVPRLKETVERLKRTNKELFGDTAEPKEIIESRLPEKNNRVVGVSKEEFNHMGYHNRLKIKINNPDLYREYTK